MQVSWIDADEVRDLVAQLQVPQNDARTTGWDLHTLPEAGTFPVSLLSDVPPQAPVWEPAVVPEPAPSAEVNLIREKLRHIRDRAEQAGLLVPTVKPPEPPPTPAAPPLVEAAPALPQTTVPEAVTPEPKPETPAPSPGQTLTERLDAFAHWATRQTTCEELLLMDEQGDLLWGSPTRADLILSAMLAVNTARRSNAGTITSPEKLQHLTLGPGCELQVLPCSTTHGTVTLTLVNPRYVPTGPLAAALREAVEC